MSISFQFALGNEYHIILPLILKQKCLYVAKHWQATMIRDKKHVAWLNVHRISMENIRYSLHQSAAFFCTVQVIRFEKNHMHPW
mmetsp:Transcript_14492/g.17915  ORF Transcript_14492/g.17915 Transcript_14492/m.17915 type:complete len:84 (-) Transcript_14492:338-589(-)